MSEFVGTRISRVLGNDSLADRTIIAVGRSALILGIYVSCDGVSDIVSVQDVDGNAITDLAIFADDTSSITSPFIVEKNGFIVISNNSAATTYITVIYRLDI